MIHELRHEISNNVVCATSKAADQPAHTHSLIRAFASRLNITVEASTLNPDQTAMIEVVFSDVRIPSKTVRNDIRICEGNFHKEARGVCSGRGEILF